MIVEKLFEMSELKRQFPLALFCKTMTYFLQSLTLVFPLIFPTYMDKKNSAFACFLAQNWSFSCVFIVRSVYSPVNYTHRDGHNGLNLGICDAPKDIECALA